MAEAKAAWPMVVAGSDDPDAPIPYVLARGPSSDELLVHYLYQQARWHLREARRYFYRPAGVDMYGNHILKAREMRARARELRAPHSSGPG